MNGRAVLCAVALAALWPVTAQAQEVWGGVSLGMPRAEVERLHPKADHVDFQKSAIEISDITVTDECKAEVNIRFNHDVVESIMIAGDPSMGGRCSETILTQLSAKYGQPANWTGSAGSILGRQGQVAIWRRPDGVAMRFKKYTNGIFGGGGLLKASWELEYTLVATDFEL